MSKLEIKQIGKTYANGVQAVDVYKRQSKSFIRKVILRILSIPMNGTVNSMQFPFVLDCRSF